MKKLFIFSLLLITITFSSCTTDSDNGNDSQSTSQTTGSLEGTWRLQNISAGSKLTFKGQTWKIESGTVTITGTFTLSGNTMNAVSNDKDAVLQPPIFSGNVEIVGNKVTFTNFSGNWREVFSTWYGKQ